MHGIETQIIAASIRNPIHVIDCAKAGADIATVPYKVLLQMIHHPLTDEESANFRTTTAKYSESKKSLSSPGHRCPPDLEQTRIGILKKCLYALQK